MPTKTPQFFLDVLKIGKYFSSGVQNLLMTGVRIIS
jgi:hypothetical protein